MCVCEYLRVCGCMWVCMCVCACVCGRLCLTGSAPNQNPRSSLCAQVASCMRLECFGVFNMCCLARACRLVVRLLATCTCISRARFVICKRAGVAFSAAAACRRHCPPAVAPRIPRGVLRVEMALLTPEVLVCRANPEALEWTVEALNPLVLQGIQPAYISKGANLTWDLTWLLVGSKLANQSSCWDSGQNFGVELPVRGSMA